MSPTARRSRLASATAWSVVAMTAAASVLHVVLVVLRPDATLVAVPLVDGLQTLPLVVLAVVGALVIQRLPGLNIGWLLLAASLQVFQLALRRYWQAAVLLGMPQPPPPVAWLASWLWLPPFVALSTLVPLLFPTGPIRPFGPPLDYPHLEACGASLDSTSATHARSESIQPGEQPDCIA